MSAPVQFGDDFAFSDIRAAVVLDDGTIARTLNGRPMTPGTSLFLRTSVEAAAPELLDGCRIALEVAESWIHDQLDGTSSLEGALAGLDPVRAAIAAATGEKA